MSQKKKAAKRERKQQPANEQKEPKERETKGCKKREQNKSKPSKRRHMWQTKQSKPSKRRHMWQTKKKRHCAQLALRDCLIVKVEAIKSIPLLYQIAGTRLDALERLGRDLKCFKTTTT
jgi:hypothetical protein